MKQKVTVTHPDQNHGYAVNATREHSFLATGSVIVRLDRGFPGSDVTAGEPDEVEVYEEGNPHNRIFCNAGRWGGTPAIIKIELVE
jgi:hypothetical protein